MFDESRFLSYISKVLRFGVIGFIVLSVISYVFKILAISYYHKILDLAVFILIITPILRIIMLFYGFIRLNEYKFAIYSLIVLISIFIGINI